MIVENERKVFSMKIKYYSELLDKNYNSEEACIQAEDKYKNEHKEELESKENLSKELTAIDEIRAKISSTRKKLDALTEEYNKAYAKYNKHLKEYKQKFYHDIYFFM